MRNLEKGAVLTDVANAERLPLEVIQLDVDDPISADRAVLTVQQKAGRIDVLINNAGIGGDGAVEETSEELVRAVFENNFFGVMRLVRTVLPRMRQRRAGAIVNVTFMSGPLHPFPATSFAAA